MNGQPGTVYPGSSFDVAAVPAAPGTNTLTATYVGPAFTNVPMTATDTSTVVLGDAAYTHDANGNLTSDATFLYQYDLANQLTNVVRKADNAVVLQCRYDALGRRVEAIRSDGTVDRYVYFPGSFLVLAVLDETNTCKEFYTRGPDLSGTLDSAGGISGILACTYASGPVLYHHADLMGNVISLSDSAASIESTLHYTPFGQLSLLFGTGQPRYLFSSKEWDADVSLVYYGYRHYSPFVMRWTTRDAILEVAHLNLYCGNRNDFINNVDYFGLYGKKGWYPPAISPKPEIRDLTAILDYASDTFDIYKKLSDYDALMEKGREGCNWKFQQWLNDGYPGPTFVDPDAKLSSKYEGIHCCVILLIKENFVMQGQDSWHYLDYVQMTFYPCTTCSQAEIEEKKKMSLYGDELTPPNVQYEEILQFITYNTLPSL